MAESIKIADKDINLNQIHFYRYLVNDDYFNLQIKLQTQLKLKTKLCQSIKNDILDYRHNNQTLRNIISRY